MTHCWCCSWSRTWPWCIGWRGPWWCPAAPCPQSSCTGPLVAFLCRGREEDPCWKRSSSPNCTQSWQSCQALSSLHWHWHWHCHLFWLHFCLVLADFTPPGSRSSFQMRIWFRMRWLWCVRHTGGGALKYQLDDFARRCEDCGWRSDPGGSPWNWSTTWPWGWGCARAIAKEDKAWLDCDDWVQMRRGPFPERIFPSSMSQTLRWLWTRSCWTPSGTSLISTQRPSSGPAKTSAVRRSTSSLAFFSSVATTQSPITYYMFR
jgi:hypothetical protein